MNSSLVKAMVSVLFIVCVVCGESGFWQDVCIVLCIQVWYLGIREEWGETVLMCMFA